MARFATITPIVPKGGFSLDRRIEKRNLDAAFEEAADEVQEEFGKTVETWKTAVVFQISRPNNETAVIKPASGKPAEIYGYVDRGTKPHIIRAKRAKALRFSTSFGPKTSPKFIGSTKGYRGTDVVFTKEVHHPGIEARKFSITIAKKWKKEWPKIVRKYLRRRK